MKPGQDQGAGGGNDRSLKTLGLSCRFCPAEGSESRFSQLLCPLALLLNQELHLITLHVTRGNSSPPSHPHDRNYVGGFEASKPIWDGPEDRK